jgi:hypothetical protein
MLFGLPFGFGDRGNAFLRKVDKYLPDYTASQSQNIVFVVVSAVRTSNPAWIHLDHYQIQCGLPVKEHDKEA